MNKTDVKDKTYTEVIKQAPQCRWLHKWGLWEMIEEKIIPIHRVRDDAKIAEKIVLVQDRTCLRCHKLQVKTQVKQIWSIL